MGLIMKDLHIKIPTKLHSDFSEACGEEERTMSDVIKELIRGFLDARENSARR